MADKRIKTNDLTSTLAQISESCQETENLQIGDEVNVGETAEVFFVEPYFGGSHKQLIDVLIKHVPKSKLITMSAKKWHWRARCGALILSTIIPKVTTERVLFCSSVLNLAELLGMRADLQHLKKVVYFHENQLVYPIREIKERDIQFGYNQITTCLAADIVLFNSHYNKNSFLENINKLLKLFPDYKPKNLRGAIEPKCKVLYFPIQLPTPCTVSKTHRSILHIVWPHRWEFDKGPEEFIRVLFRLKYEKIEFRLSLLGESFSDVPEIVSQAKEVLKDEILQFGYLENKEEYYKVLRSSDICVSTAQHEFFGVSMLESVHLGCFPLVPDRLVYPEIYPFCCLYKNESELYLRLKRYCLDPSLLTKDREDMQINVDKYSINNLLPYYLELFE